MPSRYSLRPSLFVLYSILGPKYCPVSKNKSYQFTNVPIILLLYFQNHLKKKNNKYLKNQSNWGTFLVASFRITFSKKKKLINLFKGSFVNLYYIYIYIFFKFRATVSYKRQQLTVAQLSFFLSITSLLWSTL